MEFPSYLKKPHKLIHMLLIAAMDKYNNNIDDNENVIKNYNCTTL